MNKKVLVSAFALSMVFGLTGCSSEKPEEKKEDTKVVEKKEEKKEEKKDKKYLRREFSYSKFQQTILLPENVEKDKISAKVEHGILSIEIPKMKEEEKQKTSKAIEVK